MSGRSVSITIYTVNVAYRPNEKSLYPGDINSKLATTYLKNFQTTLTFCKPLWNRKQMISFFVLEQQDSSAVFRCSSEVNMALWKQTASATNGQEESTQSRAETEL